MGVYTTGTINRAHLEHVHTSESQNCPRRRANNPTALISPFLFLCERPRAETTKPKHASETEGGNSTGSVPVRRALRCHFGSWATASVSRLCDYSTPINPQEKETCTNNLDSIQNINVHMKKHVSKLLLGLKLLQSASFKDVLARWTKETPAHTLLIRVSVQVIFIKITETFCRSGLLMYK